MAGNGQGGDLWKAVKIAKNINVGEISLNLTLDGVPIAPTDSANAFATYFFNKTKKLL